MLTKKSQVSIEYLLVIGLVMVLLIILFSVFSTRALYSIKETEASEAVTSLARAADFISAMGPGSKTYVSIRIPGGVEGGHVNNKEIVLKMKIYNGIADISSKTSADITGSVPVEKGMHKVKVEQIGGSGADSGTVKIGE